MFRRQKGLVGMAEASTQEAEAKKSGAGTTGRKEENRADRTEEQDSDEGEEKSAKTTRRKREGKG